jgi:hypothetical protein
MNKQSQQFEQEIGGAYEIVASTPKSEIDKTILSGGEAISVFEVMQRFRSEGSCEGIVRDALVNLADEPLLREARECEWQSLADYQAKLKTIQALLRELTDPDPCSFDHHGYCQAHGYFETEPKCPHARAKDLIGKENNAKELQALLSVSLDTLSEKVPIFSDGFRLCELFCELERMGIFDSEITPAVRTAIIDRINTELSNVHEPIAQLEAQVEALCDAWRKDIRAHMDGCPAMFSNCVPDDCGCTLTEAREAEIKKIKETIYD